MLKLDECVGRSEVGAKAERLGRARAAGLPALDGVVILPDEVIVDKDLTDELARLGGERFIVRSSSLAEDRPGRSAAGVFLTVANARGLEEVKAAIARVRASAGDEPARAYLGAPQPMAVLIQPMIDGRLGVAVGESDGWLIEERAAGEPEWGDVQARRLASDEADPLATILRELDGTSLEIEFARPDLNTVKILQIRPRGRGPLEAIDAAFEHFGEPGRWRLDAEHNPRPLSAAQAGLVALVEELGVGARQRVVAGWLFVEVGGPPRGLQPLPLADLRRRFDEEVAPDCFARLAEAEKNGGLEAALAAYQHVYRRYVGEVAPSITRARAQLDQMLKMNLKEPLAQHGELLGGVGGAALERDQALWELGHEPARLDEYLRRFGAWAPAWDVAAPPDDEAKERVLEAARAITSEPRACHHSAEAAAEAAASALLERLDRMARRAFKALLPTVRAAVAVGEDDDALFFAAQRLVRRALAALQLPLDHEEDVYNLPLPLLRAGAQDWKKLAAEGKAQRAIAERISPPPLIVDGKPQPQIPPATRVLQGHATSGRARGRAYVLRDPATATATPDAILVTPAILPSLAYLLPGCRALVTAHGGATSHGATLAREYGIPAVLGAHGADQIEDGRELYVDGAAGRVYLL